jgi:peptidoglycan/LPS O-acetylase OafA/YrhL
MLIAVAVLTAFCLLPTEIVNFAKSLLAATLSGSNFYFWQHSGYFDSPNSNPLLHTWSLAVEEQFYILFPLFLVLVRRNFPRQLKRAVVGVFFVSLLLSAAILPYSRNTAFYMPFTRAWELLLGTLLSLGLFPRMELRILRNLAALAGIGMIACSVLFYAPNMPFPGFSALLPCIGSALIIGAGESGSSLVGSALSWRPAVFVGLISYSLYLWHWPVIVVHKMGVFLSMNSTLPNDFANRVSQVQYDRVIEVVVSFFLAIVSWRFIERPFRNGSLKLSGRRLFVLAGAVMALVIVFASLTIVEAGFSGRFSPQSVKVASYLDNTGHQASMREGTCFITTGNRFSDFDENLCLRSINGKPDYLLLGDSHSAMLWKALSSSFPSDNIMQANTSGCKPFVHPPGSPDCKKMMDFLFKSFLPSHPVQGLLLENRWGPGDISGITETLAWATQRRIPVVLFGPVQEYDSPLPRLLAYAITWNQPQLPAQHRSNEFAHLDSQFERLAASTWHVPYVSLLKATCSDGVCTEYVDAEHLVPLMFDGDHFSQEGALMIVKRLIASGELRL